MRIKHLWPMPGQMSANFPSRTREVVKHSELVSNVQAQKPGPLTETLYGNTYREIVWALSE